MMRYVEFRDRIQKKLQRNPSGLTWTELRDQLDLPYDRPCAAWIKRLEEEIALSRARGTGRAYVWKINR